MKKVSILSFLVFAVLWSGCGISDSAQSADQSRPAVTKSGSSYFWDKDLRPTVAVPSPRATRPRPAAQVAEPVLETRIEPAAPPPAPPSELMTASVDNLTPVSPQFVSPIRTYEDQVSTRPGLVAVDESGKNILSMTYPRPDYGILQVQKTMPQEVRFNVPFAYVIKVTNLTDMMLTDVVITENLPKDFEFKGCEPTATSDNEKLVWTIDSLGPKANKSIRITGLATGSKQLGFWTAVTHTIKDSAVVNVVEPTLELAQVAPSEALLCEPIPIDFVVTNTGTGAAQNVQIIDTLPAGMQTADGKVKIVLDAGTLAAGESRRFSIKVRATRTGAFVHKAVASSATGLKAEAEATLTNVRQPALSITKSGPARGYLGRSISYEITVVNIGDGPARDTMIEDIVPPGVTGIEATAGAQSTGSKLVWQLGTLEPNVSKTVRVSYTPTREGDVMATATATAYCTQTVSDSAKTAIRGIPASRLQVIDLEDPVEVGTTTTYVVTVSNEGSAADTNIRIACMLDEKLQYVSSAGATAGSIMGNAVSFSPLRRLEPKSKATWRIVVRGARAGDVRFKVTMHTDQIALPIEHTEVTHIYQQ
ncbi:MAG: DUF11 domain-containing protein [Phycisphaerales bacterium]|nr:MAG: DUF11 domain-containing protein [Phycisphaerales bacterium]